MKIPYTQLFFVLFTLKILLKVFLNWRNVLNIKNHRGSVPAPFKEKISLEAHQKAADYSLAKHRLGFISLIIDSLMLLFWIPGRGLDTVMNQSMQLSTDPLYQSLIFFMLFSIISTIIDLPLTLYSTFVLEEKFGFNKTTFKLFVIDRIKGMILGIIIGAPLLIAILKLMEGTELWWLLAFLLMISFQFLLMWAYPKFIAPIFNKFTPLESVELKNDIFQLLDRAKLEFKDIFVMDASKRSAHGNAYFTGFGKNKRIVFFDTLLKGLNTNEIIAILAHELGHYKYKHILKSLVISTLSLLAGFYLLHVLSLDQAFWEGHYIENRNSAMLLLLFSMVTPLYTFWLTPVFAYFSRKNEFEADDFAVRMASGEALVDGLLKLYEENASTLTPDPLYSKFYYSHPPALERIEAIRKSR